MPIYFSKDVGGWVLKDVTQEEADQLMEIGKEAAIRMLGAAIMKQYQERVLQGNLLDGIPREAMAQG